MCWLFVYGREKHSYGYVLLEIYLTVILQLTTLSLLFSLSSSAVGVIPAMLSQSANIAPIENREVETLPTRKEVKIEDYLPISDSKNVERYINDYFADIPLMTHIAKCESRYRQFDHNGNVLTGEKNRHDIGALQINVLYHAKTAEKLGHDVYSLEGNVEYARYLYEKQGAKPWMASSACWAKFSESEIARR